MSYKIKSIEFKESAKGNKYAKAVFEDGKEVAIFDKFPNFSDLKAGDVVDGDLTKKEYNGKESFTLNPLNKPSTFTPKTSGAVAAAKETNKGVEKAMDRKEEGIQLSGSQRDSVLIVTSFYPEEVSKLPVAEREEFIREKITAWRQWLLDEYPNTKPPF